MHENAASPSKASRPFARPVVLNIPVTIALVLLIIFGSIGVVLTIAFYRYEKRELTQYIRNQFIALADGFAPLVREAYRSRNYGLVQNSLQTFAQHSEISFALVGERLRNVLLLGGLILLIGAVAFYLVVHIFLIRPLRSMSQVMREVTEGDLSARCPNFAGLPEVANLTHHFDHAES